MRNLTKALALVAVLTTGFVTSQSLYAHETDTPKEGGSMMGQEGMSGMGDMNGMMGMMKMMSQMAPMMEQCSKMMADMTEHMKTSPDQ